jgi:hypothetical protein
MFIGKYKREAIVQTIYTATCYLHTSVVQWTTTMDKIIFLILNELYKTKHTSLKLYIIVPKSAAAEILLVALVVVHCTTA